MSGNPPVSVVQEAASPKPEVRLHAAAVLASLGGADADDALAGLLADPDHRVRARAVAGLARAGAGGRATCAALLLDASSAAAGVAAARALAGSAAGGEALVAALSHASPTVRLRAARELPRLPPAGFVAPSRRPPGPSRTPTSAPSCSSRSAGHDAATRRLSSFAPCVTERPMPGPTPPGRSGSSEIRVRRRVSWRYSTSPASGPVPCPRSRFSRRPKPPRSSRDGERAGTRAPTSCSRSRRPSRADPRPSLAACAPCGPG